MGHLVMRGPRGAAMAGRERERYRRGSGLRLGIGGGDGARHGLEQRRASGREGEPDEGDRGGQREPDLEARDDPSFAGRCWLASHNRFSSPPPLWDLLTVVL
jgi:hypothetical protein